ncbi:F-box protein SKIP28-like [Brassica napus]|uniref:F-box protein SKIP28-like n=1 Tax=Brassica napus TaxID=3708 RepID=UPI00207A825B|nr:F-box protein SKIP28-like [Brassica napus]
MLKTFLPCLFAVETVESSRITRCAIIPNSFPKLGEVDEISSDAAFIAEYPGEESDDGERTDDCVGEAGDGVWFLYVSSDRRQGDSSSSVSVLDEARGSRGHGGNAETLHINGVPGFTKDHLSALSTYLPQEGAIDLEVCPKCDQVRIIPPCSRESCKREGRKARECRGCWYCVPRCMECAVCLGPDTEVEEAACEGDVVCLACCQALPKCRFCNKPYCTSHSSLRQGNTTTDAAMFACQACDYRTGASASDPIVLD